MFDLTRKGFIEVTPEIAIIHFWHALWKGAARLADYAEHRAHLAWLRLLRETNRHGRLYD